MKTSVFIATSLDGYIARKDGGLDWLPENPEPHGYEEFIATVDSIVIGRGTYETVLGFDSWAYGKTPVFVLTSKPSSIHPPKGAVCEAMNANPREVFERLEKRGLQHLYVDGGVTITRFLEAGLIGRMALTRIPVLLGSGIPLFGSLPKDIRLRHEWTRSFPSGIVQSEYTIES